MYLFIQHGMLILIVPVNGHPGVQALARATNRYLCMLYSVSIGGVLYDVVRYLYIYGPICQILNPTCIR